MHMVNLSGMNKIVGRRLYLTLPLTKAKLLLPCYHFQVSKYAIIIVLLKLQRGKPDK